MKETSKKSTFLGENEARSGRNEHQNQSLSRKNAAQKRREIARRRTYRGIGAKNRLALLSSLFTPRRARLEKGTRAYRKAARHRQSAYMKISTTLLNAALLYRTAPRACAGQASIGGDSL